MSFTMNNNYIFVKNKNKIKKLIASYIIAANKVNKINKI